MQRTIYRLLCFCFLLGSFHTVKAIDEKYAAPPLRGNQLAADSTSMVMDTVYFNPALKPLQTTYFVKNLITFTIDESHRYMLPDEFDVSVTFKIHYTYDNNGTPVTSVTEEPITLSIGYTKYTTYTNKQVYIENDWYKVEIEIVSISGSGNLSEYRDALVLTNEIFISREYNFSCTNNAIQQIFSSSTHVNTKGELNVYWLPERAADEYDLEWTYIDDSALINYKKVNDPSKYDPKKLFTNNATRVSVSRENYYIPLLYEASGHLFYRVRAVQVKQHGQRIESVWSSDYTNGLGSYGFKGLDSALNWQASTSFAEEGKRKSVVQYFDGSLKSRQTVTKDNTTDTTIIAETFYDHQGRPVIQVMPTPSLSSIIKYTPGFNRLNSAEYEKDSYDDDWQDSCYCAQGAPVMDTLYGAAQYYSPANPLATSGYHKFIPNAKGYVFAETRYTPDNTGRVSIQSGVGETFQIGKGHETKYTYNMADQEELDALFGTEVGNASHYFKNTVRDANGQVSISYVDMHGRTIATALAGMPPVAVDALPSNNSYYITKKLLDSNSNVIKGTVIESSKGLVVTKAGSHQFIYSLLPDSISIRDCNNINICYDCIYDLQITITDECNNTTLPNGEPVVINKTNYHLDSACNALSAFPAIDTMVYLQEGSYLVTKTLTVNKQAMDYYRDSLFLVRNACRSLQQTIQEQKSLLATTLQCVPACSTCTASLSDWEVYRNSYMQQAGIANSDTANYRIQAQMAWKAELEECQKLCDSVVALHQSIEQQMLADVTPPYGQYANPDSIDMYSVFWKPTGEQENYKNVTGNYKDENGNDEEPDPRDMASELFTASFKNSWAETLLQKHPEYLKLVRFKELAASNIWDQHFAQTDTYQEAVAKGYLNAGDFSTHPTGGIFVHNTTYRDPFFTDLISQGKVAGSYKTQMEAALLDKVRDANDNAISMWSLATIMANCPASEATCVNQYKSLDSAFTHVQGCAGDQDMAWKFFREMYLQKKRDLVNDILTEAQQQHTNPDYWDMYLLAGTGHTLNFYHPAMVSVNDMPTNEQAARDSLQKYINDNCAAYVEQWWADLGPCNYNSTDSAWIIPRLIDVCREGGDEEHFFGASTVKPSSNYVFKSFEDVLKFYSDSTGKPYNAACNVYLISAPLPYDQQPVYTNKPVYQQPDSCECATISLLYNQYQSAAIDSSFADYLYRTSGTQMTPGALDTLRMACNGQINCNYLNAPVFLPPVLQCGVKDVCVSCARVDSLNKDFKTDFPGVYPAISDAGVTDSLQQSWNLLYERFMNNHLGYGKTASEYLAFSNQCSLVQPTEACDSLSQLVNDFKFNYFFPDTSNCNSAHFRVSRNFNNSYVLADSNVAKVFSGGIAHIPEGITDFPLDSTGSAVSMGYWKYDTLCVDNEFTLKARVKMPLQANVGRYGYVNLVFYSDNVTFSPTFSQFNPAYDTASAIQYNGYWLVDNGVSTFPTGMVSMMRNFATWRIITINAHNNVFKVYLDDSLVLNVPYTGKVNKIFRMACGFSGTAGETDWIKVYDAAGVLQYKEEFEDCKQSPSNYPDVFTCPKSGCDTSFANYYNTRKGTSYTYSQIEDLYKTTCGKELNACGNSKRSDILNTWLNEYKKYGGIPHLDASGSDTTHWKVNFGGAHYTYGFPLGEVIKNGIMALPSYYADTTAKKSFGIDYLHDTLCLDTAGYTWEARLKLPDSLVSTNGFNASWWLWLYTDSTAGSMQMSISKVDGMGVAVCTHNNDSKKSCANENVPGQHFNDWRVVKFQFRGREFKYYIDDSLMAQRTLDTPMTKLRRWSLQPYSVKAQIDYVKIYDVAGNLLYNENFDDAHNLAMYGNRGRCSPCETRFSNYFNNRNNSNLTYASIDSIYFNSSGVHLSLCEGSPLALCGKTEPVFAPVAWKPRTVCTDSTLFATSTSVLLQEAYRDSLIGSFNDRYLAKCLSARYNENFTVYQQISEFHYTLYYYDQAGNLLKTVPPEGVNVSKFAWARAWSDSVTTARRNKQYLVPQHKLPTQYRYNTLNQVVTQKSPDGGTSEFWYDRLGRLAISRNARQRTASATEEGSLYSYTKYDSLGRITEVGQVSNTGANGAMTNAISRNQPSLNNWLLALHNRRGQITNTVYDLPYTGFEGLADQRLVISQKNLRNRVSYTTLTDTGLYNVYSQGTFYTYDILGNVDQLLQDYGCESCFGTTANVMNTNGNRWKKIGYQYDLISGKVNMVIYQQGWRDGFFHRYSYDAENRLTLVETSRDSLVWEKDARYEYYRHGPLARVTLGDQQVQGLDYAYTLQGWLKGINSTGGTDSFDMGGDGRASSLNRYTAKDALGLTLNYFGNDYAAINGTPFPGYSAYLPAYRPLYNGNISSSSVYQSKFDYYNSPGGPLIFYNYKYDQLNRLTAQDAYKGFNGVTNSWSSMTTMGDYLKERVAYDANGNIKKYLRNSISGTTAQMDSLNYYYYANTNQLRRVTDNVPANAFVSKEDDIIRDIENQADSNYVYDSIGNLITDNAASITHIKWNVYGKIQEIIKAATADAPATNIKYSYDVAGNRIGQVVTSAGTKHYTWYVRDAQGNILTTYTADGDESDLEDLDLELKDRFLYGSSRLGVMTVDDGVDGGPGSMQYYYEKKSYDRGYKQYELTNHLGNVLATISDRKFGVPSAGSSLIDHYEPHIVTAQDYYPFGMLSRVALPNSNVPYKFGFNGKMNDDEVKGLGNQQDYGMRIYDARVGRFLSVDPLTKGYPELTPYQFASNTPIEAIDLDGLEESSSKKEGFWKAFGKTVLKGVEKAVEHVYNNPNHAGYGYTPSMKTPNPADFKKYDVNLLDQIDPRLQAQAFSDNLVFGTTNFIGGITEGNGEKTAKALPAFVGTVMALEGIKMNFGFSLKPKVKLKAATLDPMESSMSRKLTEPLPSSRVTIGLGIAQDLPGHRGTGAITWKNAAWQEAGLTKVDYGKMYIGDEFAIKEAFRDAVKNADAVRFDVTGFDPFTKNPGVTNYEFNYINNDPALLQKTTFIQNGGEVTWDGKMFKKK
ncbi:RHS repeat protein [Niastella caeni]|uniref:RHS repeat protein n=1 Tax=Niastella caeni TaxID=2569763 RepID=A0A4V4GZ00_9BACT|nr:RHS repeat-associated core domain-containing protein [Niastella caeni]THU30796.1 RHS repeat protein [Niastella caeni]